MNKNKEFPYAGIPTFLKSDLGTIESLNNYQVGVFEVPLDIGTTNGVGARFGPSAIKRTSTRYNKNTYFGGGKFSAIDLYQN